MKLVCLSDTHGMYSQVSIPDGDVLIIAGDFTNFGKREEGQEFNEFLGTLPHKHKIVIAGNHDAFCQEHSFDEVQAVLSNAIYLQDSGVTINSYYFYGSPWTPLFYDWYFMLPRGSKELQAVWDKIPDQTNVLITHGPPAGKLDFSHSSRDYVGCSFLRSAVERVKPTYHIFGHNHECYGFAFNEYTVFANVSTCDRAYRPINPPVVLDLPL